MRIRSLLLLVTTVIFVPGFLAAVMAVQKVREGERTAAINGLRETVRASALLVDVEIQRSIGALTALAQSDSLREGDLHAFYEQARGANRPPHVWTLLFDEDGNQLLNTLEPLGTRLPSVAKERVQQVLDGGEPVVSDLLVGPVSGKLLTSVYVPTKAWNGKRYVVAHAYALEHWRATALQVENGSAATIGVIDRTGRFISRNVNADDTLGKPARAELVAAAASASEGLIRHQTLEGVDAYDAFTHSEKTGWTVAVAMPVSTVERSAIQAVQWLAVSGLLALGAGLLAAYYLGRTFMQVIDQASRAALAVGVGQAPDLGPTRLVEVNTLYDALAGAGRLLTQERQSREAAERERERLLARETALRETAERENTAKDQFLALLGHELRNPLAAISGATAVLSHQRSTPEAREKFLGIIQRQNRHLSHIVNDLLDVSRLMSGKIVLESRRLNLADWVTSCADALRTTEKAAGHKITVQADDVWVLGDGVRIEQIVNNLVFNSLKCSPAGSEVRITVRAEGDDAVLTVQDDGVGIGADLLPHIFEPFVQGPPPPGRMSSGLGIGLALVKQLVALHGGEVQAYSAGPGQGATFTVKLPRAEAGTLPGQRLPAPGAGARRVLLVEDDRDAMAAMSELLRLMGHEVVTARTRDEALAALDAQPVDLALLDIGLPVHDGYAVATELRNRAGSRTLPLIALTGYGREADRARALAAGFDAHLSKPVDPDLLARTIEQATAAKPPA
ncbi:ATP-binding protein [Piscinibacter gummiphilus]|uniref:histidine kinase n=1 Tax=Piscinibacter gummiphilus TaxID=946333 RepID=A0ABZ0CTT8_9BURK|nr:ATP-binding protein [Piscinibacter gummiphilus]WOB05954.1 ATP-binding protein [Piscinibacter gummiphilus]